MTLEIIHRPLLTKASTKPSKARPASLDKGITPLNKKTKKHHLLQPKAASGYLHNPHNFIIGHCLSNAPSKKRSEVGAGLEEAEVDPRPMGYRELAKDIGVSSPERSTTSFQRGLSGCERTPRSVNAERSRCCSPKDWAEEDVAKSDEKVVDEEKPEEKVAVEPEVKPGDVNVTIEDDEVFEVEAEVATETTGAAAKSRAQVLSPEDRKAELRARFARAPARVRQLQRETEVDPESL